jgi:hypothetical protein
VGLPHGPVRRHGPCKTIDRSIDRSPVHSSSRWFNSVAVICHIGALYKYRPTPTLIAEASFQYYYPPSSSVGQDCIVCDFAQKHGPFLGPRNGGRIGNRLSVYKVDSTQKICVCHGSDVRIQLIPLWCLQKRRLTVRENPIAVIYIVGSKCNGISWWSLVSGPRINPDAGTPYRLRDGLC